MQPRGNIYIFSFALLVTLIASVMLSAAATALKPYQQMNGRLDVIKNILSVSGYSAEEISSRDSEATVKLYESEFEAEILDANNQRVERVDLEKRLQAIGYSSDDLKKLLTFELLDIFSSKLPLLARQAGLTLESYDPGYKLIFRHMPGDTLKAYIIPISGKGLWGMIYGYIALEPDLISVKGIRFYKHGETPGLGGEIEKAWFTAQFEGKKILDPQGTFTSVSITKGKASVKYEGEELTHHVDGISGATITGNAVNTFVRSDLSKFEPYFQKLRNDISTTTPLTSQGETR